MRDLMTYSKENPHFMPKQALHSYVQQLQLNQQQQQQAQQQFAAHQHAMQAQASNQGQMPGQQQQLIGMGTPHMMNAMPPGMQGSPAISNMRLDVPGSPHLSQNGAPGSTPSPAHVHLQAPGMVAQHSQPHHPTSNPSTQGNANATSANTSPNTTNKRRRASTTVVKNEAGEDGGDAGSNPSATPKVKASPRVGTGNKRQKQVT